MTQASIGDFALSQSTLFTGRLQYLLERYAKVVQTGSGDQRAASRVLATRVQDDPGHMAGLIAVSIVSDGGVSGSNNSASPADSTKTDAELDGVIQAVWGSGAWDNVQ